MISPQHIGGMRGGLKMWIDKFGMLPERSLKWVPSVILFEKPMKIKGIKQGKTIELLEEIKIPDGSEKNQHQNTGTNWK